MPQHLYLPTRNPPRWYDRILVHANDHAVAVIAFVFGLLMVLMPFTGVIPSPALGLLGAGLIFCSGAALLLGGLLVLAGLHWRGEQVSTGWGLELLGWSLVTAGLLAVGLAFSAGASPAAWIIPMLLSAGSALRWISVLLIRRNARDMVGKSREGA